MAAKNREEVSEAEDEVSRTSTNNSPAGVGRRVCKKRGWRSFTDTQVARGLGKGTLGTGKAEGGTDEAGTDDAV